MARHRTARAAKTTSGGAKRGVRTLITRGPAETQAAGVSIGRGLPAPSVVLLIGPLGSGKTTLARGLAEGLGLADPTQVSSPSFALIHVYQGSCPIYHVDLYRLAGKRDFETIGLEEFLASRGVTIVEWGERLHMPLDPAVVVELSDEGDDVRRLCIKVSPELTELLRHLGHSGKPSGNAE